MSESFEVVSDLSTHHLEQYGTFLDSGIIDSPN